jgi:hypothetical protein
MSAGAFFSWRKHISSPQFSGGLPIAAFTTLNPQICPSTYSMMLECYVAIVAEAALLALSSLSRSMERCVLWRRPAVATFAH